MRRTVRASVTYVVVFGLLAAACSTATGSNSEDRQQPAPVSSRPVAAAPTTAPPPVTDRPPTTADAGPSEVDVALAHAQEAEAIPPAASDAAGPANQPVSWGGAPGYTRYVFREYEGAPILSLVEGPRGRQTRCQAVDLPCSMSDLEALADSGAAPPPELGMSAGEVSRLVGELRALRTALAPFTDVNEACARGYVPDRTQTPNMGSHFTNLGLVLDGVFDPAEPEILIYARSDGQAPDGPLGECAGGTWRGEDVELVGTAFIQLTSIHGEDHPAGFTGPIDNWHVHYNLCRGSGVDDIVPRDECLRLGGEWMGTIGWMIHAWVLPDFDDQFGVFSMWNPTVWPVSSVDDLHDVRVVSPADDTEAVSTIENFDFGDPLTISSGSSVAWFNADSVPHTVTFTSTPEGTEPADLGVLAPGSDAVLEFDEPGQYSFYCTIHPDMTGTVVVQP
ncbi:MAG TPA: hypothetical protein ENI86_13880 [Acidimicrobiales bacterium]|nr:hypothetical protein [Acidimicrobiales bacterium]